MIVRENNCRFVTRVRTEFGFSVVDAGSTKEVIAGVPVDTLMLWRGTGGGK